MPAAVERIRIGPLAVRLFAIEPDQIDFIFMRNGGKDARHFEEKSGRRSAIVGSDEVAAGHGFGVVVAGDDDDVSGGARKFRDDVFHGDRAERSIAGEGVLDDFAMTQFELGFDVALQLMDGGRPGRTWPEGDGFAGEFERGSTAEIRAEGERSRKERQDP